MRETVFEKEAFIRKIKENLKNLYRKTLEEASQQEIFQAVSYAVKDESMTGGWQHSRRTRSSYPKSSITCRWNF